VSEAQREALEDVRSGGLYAGQINEKVFIELINEGMIERYYTGAGGLLGLAKIRLTYKGREALLNE
jgi:hypothetical protein